MSEIQTMMEEVQKNINSLIGEKYEDIAELNNGIICAFANYSVDGEDEVIISKTNGNDEFSIFECYVNASNAPSISVETKHSINENGESVDFEIVNIFNETTINA
jgi:hypothetical protein